MQLNDLEAVLHSLSLTLATGDSRRYREELQRRFQTLGIEFSPGRLVPAADEPDFLAHCYIGPVAIKLNLVSRPEGICQLQRCYSLLQGAEALIVMGAESMLLPPFIAGKPIRMVPGNPIRAAAPWPSNVF